MPYLKKANPIRIKDYNRIERQKVYQTTKWKKMRLAKLMTSPLCEICLSKGITNIAIDIHHIDSFMAYTGLKRMNKAFDFNNLQSLCKECHSKEHH